MNTIKQAIIMAAGLGSRMNPITLTTPKPLVTVNGKRMIDTVIEALHKNDIYQIYIVVGYLKEQFLPLEKQYSGVKLIENPYFNTCNNISSLYVARDYIEDSIILDGDQIIYNPAILFKEFYRSGYNSVWVDSTTNEWLQTIDDNKRVISCSRTGGRHGWQLYSISRWNKQDAIKLKKLVDYEFNENNNKNIYWDDVALFCHPNEFNLTIYPMNENDVIEIDNYNELIAIDNSYIK